MSLPALIEVKEERKASSPFPMAFSSMAFDRG